MPNASNCPTISARCGAPHLPAGDDYGSQMQRHHKRFCAIAYHILGNADDAEDVVQQAHLQALTHLDQFEGRAALTTWLTRIVTNEALIRLRRRVSSIDIEEITLASPRQNPEQEAVRSQMEAALLATIESLPEPYRTVFYVQVIGEKTARQTAAQLGVTVACVKTRLRRAKALVKDRLHRQLGTGWRRCHA